MPERRKAKCVLADIETKAQWHRWPSEAKARAFLEATAKDRIRCFNTLMDAEEKAGFAKFCKFNVKTGAADTSRLKAGGAPVDPKPEPCLSMTSLLVLATIAAGAYAYYAKKGLTL